MEHVRELWWSGSEAGRARLNASELRSSRHTNHGSQQLTRMYESVFDMTKGERKQALRFLSDTQQCLSKRRSVARLLKQAQHLRLRLLCDQLLPWSALLVDLTIKPVSHKATGNATSRQRKQRWIRLVIMEELAL